MIWQDEAYWKLPVNARNAIDYANFKSKKTSTVFENKLDSLLERIQIFKSVFYKNKPKYEKNFVEREKNRLLKIRANKEMLL